MDNPDAVLHALKEFAENRRQSIPQVLEEYLCYVAITGKPLFPWSLLKPLFVAKMEKVLRDIHGDYLDQFKPHYFKIKSPTFDAFKKRIMKGVNEIDGIPFTVQRLCELLAYPRENYNSGEKYLKALFKVILVVTTIDPSGKVVAPSRPKFKRGKVVGQLQGDKSLYSSSDTSNPAAGSSHPNQTSTADVSYDDPSPSTSHSHHEEPESMDSSAGETSTAAEASMDETVWLRVQSMASAWKLPPRLKCGKRWKKAPSARGWQRLEDIQAGSSPFGVVGALRSIVEMEVEDDEGEDNTPHAGDTDKDTDTADLPAATMDSRDAKRQRSPGAAPRPAEDISSSQHSRTAVSPPPKKKWLAAYDDKYGSSSSSNNTASGEVNRSEESAQIKLHDSDSSSKSKDDSNQSKSSTDSSTNSSKSKGNSDQSENRTDSSSCKSKDDSVQSESRTDGSSCKSKDDSDQSENRTDSSSCKSKDDFDQSENRTDSSSKSKDDFDQSENRTDSSSKSKDNSDQSENRTDSSSKSKDNSDQSENRTDCSSKSKDESDQSESRTDDDSVNDEEKTVSTADSSSDSDSTTSAEETPSLDLSPPPLSDGSPAAPVTETCPAFSSQAESPHSDQAK
ncbi:hypothetical protein ACOMHN_015059 [Nucella lapillus]